MISFIWRDQSIILIIKLKSNILMRTAPWHLMTCYCTFVTCVYLLLYCCCHDASHGTITLPPPYVTVAMRLLFIDAVLVSDVTGLKAVRKLLSHQSTESFPNGIINMLLDSVRPSFVFFLVCSGFLLGLLHGFSFLLFNYDLNWGPEAEPDIWNTRGLALTGSMHVEFFFFLARNDWKINWLCFEFCSKKNDFI